MNYDVIIIGAGLGGLTAGATLAKNGKKVIVLEQHNIPGGCATTVNRNGVKYEIGLHEMDWGTPDRDMKALIFKKIGILNTLPIVKLPQTWKIKTETHEYTIPEGRKNVIKYLGGMFPEEKTNIKRYFSKIKFSSSIAGKLVSDLTFIEFLLFPIRILPSVVYDIVKNSTVGIEMDKIFKSNRVRNILNVNLAYYSDNPYELSWHYYSCAQYAYYNSGVFIKGGSQVLSDQLVDVIRANGGEVKMLADVQRIELNGDKATGVTYYDKKTKQNITISAGKIIANIDPQNIFNGKMVSETFREQKIEKQEIATSLYSVYITFKKAPSKVYKNISYSTFFASEELLDSSMKDIATNLKDVDIEKRYFVFVDYSTIDSGLVKEDDPRSFGVFCSTSHISEWDNLSDKDYKIKKEQLAKALFERVEKHYPGITDMVERYEISTPKTIKRYIRSSDGTAYGYKNKEYPLISRAPRRSKVIKNLHYAGAFTFPGGGFSGAIVSGYYAAMDLLIPMRTRIIKRTILTAIAVTTTILIIKFMVDLLVSK